MPGFFFVSRSGGTDLPSLKVSCAGELPVRGGIVPLAELVAVAERLVDHQLSVVAERDLHALQRPGRGAFEVDAVFRVPRAVAGTLELVLRAQPPRRAAEVRANSEQRIDRGAGAHDPHALALHPLLGYVAHRIFDRVAGLERSGRLEQHAREEHAQDRQAGGGETGEDRAPGGERKQVAPCPDAVTALRLGYPWVAAGHELPSERAPKKSVLPVTNRAGGSRRGKA